MRRLPNNGDEYLRLSVHLEFVEKAAKLSTIEETPQHVVRGLVEDIIVKHGVAPFGHFQQALINIAVEMRLPIDPAMLIKSCCIRCVGTDDRCFHRVCREQGRSAPECGH